MPDGRGKAERARETERLAADQRRRLTEMLNAGIASVRAGRVVGRAEYDRIMEDLLARPVEGVRIRSRKK